jgi:hypothetical protein
MRTIPLRKCSRAAARAASALRTAMASKSFSCSRCVCVMRLARAVARGRTLDLAPLEEMAGHWDAAFGALRERLA